MMTRLTRCLSSAALRCGLFWLLLAALSMPPVPRLGDRGTSVAPTARPPREPVRAAMKTKPALTPATERQPSTAGRDEPGLRCTEAGDRTSLNAFEQRTLEYLTGCLSSAAGVGSKTLTYQELARAMDPDINPRDRRFKRLAGTLHQVNLHDAEHGRPLPGAMVVRASDGLPGEGFYWSARQAGREFDDSPTSDGGHIGPAAIAYWRKELADLIEYWARPEQEPEATQLKRMEAKLDRIIKHLAA
jgi:hypothetical protein